MPFILVAPAGSLEYLRSYGFRTFDKFWDESYDSVTDDNDRLDKISRLVTMLNSLTEDETRHMQQRMASTVEYNRQWFYGGGFESVLKKEFEAMISQW
jgi:hypothetical protein